MPRSSTRKGGDGTQHSDLRFLMVRPAKLYCYGVAGRSDDAVGGGKYPRGPHKDFDTVASSIDVDNRVIQRLGVILYYRRSRFFGSGICPIAACCAPASSMAATQASGIVLRVTGRV